MQPGNNPRNSESRYSLSRRNVLLSGILGGSTLLAGCLGDDDGTDDDGPLDLDDIEDVHVENQQLRIAADYLVEPPAELHFLTGIADEALPDTTYSEDLNYYQATNEFGIWTRAYHDAYEPDPGPEFSGIFESVDVGVETTTVTIREDAYWSDGEPVRARDALANTAIWRFPHEDEGWQLDPEGTWVTDAVNGVNMPDGDDGRTFELELADTEAWREIGGFQSDPITMLYWIAGPHPRRGPRFPSHVEPFKSMADHAIPDFEDLVGEGPEDVAQRPELTAEYTTEAHIEASRNGEIPTFGAWTIKEVHGDQGVILEPNEYHRHYDRINFDEVFIEYSPEGQRTYAALQSESLDYAHVEASPDVADSLPSRYEQFTYPSVVGYGISVDHRSPFGDPRVRQAMMYALDANHIAQNVHPDAAAPIHTPGWDNWAAEAVLDEGWAEENLLTYEQDLDRAAELMREAGYERGSDDVWEKDGEPLEAELATDADAPIFETTVENQLSEFGIELSVRTYDTATFVERYEGSATDEWIEDPDEASGDFDLWVDTIGGESAGFYTSLQGLWWTMLANRWESRARGLFAHEDIEDALANYIEAGWVAGMYDLWEVLTIDIPPIGEPDGTPEPFNVAYTTGRVNVGPVAAEEPQPDNPYYDTPFDELDERNFDHYWQQVIWAGNWHLPVLPIVRLENQAFVNTENWIWPNQVDDHGIFEDMWEYYGIAFDSFNLAGGGEILADPNNPKEGAEVNDGD